MHLYSIIDLILLFFYLFLVDIWFLNILKMNKFFIIPLRLGNMTHHEYVSLVSSSLQDLFRRRYRDFEVDYVRVIEINQSDFRAFIKLTYKSTS